VCVCGGGGIILPFMCFETRRIALRRRHYFQVLENKVLRKIFVLNTEDS